MPKKNKEEYDEIHAEPIKKNSFKNLLKKLNLEKLTINAGDFLSAEISFKDDVNFNPVWELYIELITRITTQKLPDDVGVNQTALDSIYKVFVVARDLLKEHKKAYSFCRIVIPMLNIIMRPFLAKWHKISVENKWQDENLNIEFRNDLIALQKDLVTYSKILASILNFEEDIIVD